MFVEMRTKKREINPSLPTIVDTEFEEDFPEEFMVSDIYSDADADADAGTDDAEPALAISWVEILIDVYESRGKEVARNVLFAIQWATSTYPDELTARHNYYSKYSEKYRRYADQIAALMVLI